MKSVLLDTSNCLKQERFSSTNTASMPIKIIFKRNNIWTQMLSSYQFYIWEHTSGISASLCSCVGWLTGGAESLGRCQVQLQSYVWARLSLPSSKVKLYRGWLGPIAQHPAKITQSTNNHHRQNHHWITSQKERKQIETSKEEREREREREREKERERERERRGGKER